MKKKTILSIYFIAMILMALFLGTFALHLAYNEGGVSRAIFGGLMYCTAIYLTVFYLVINSTNKA